MIKETQTASTWLHTVLEHHETDTILRGTEVDLKIFKKPSNDRTLMTLLGIYDKRSGKGKIFLNS